MIQSYFESEKKAGFFALAVGIFACSTGSAFMISAMPTFYIGAAVALLAIGIMEIIVGSTLARRSDFQSRDLQKLLGDNPGEFVGLEFPRMEKIMRNFSMFKKMEIAVIVIALALILLNDEPVFSKGLGAGLLV